MEETAAKQAKGCMAFLELMGHISFVAEAVDQQQFAFEHDSKSCHSLQLFEIEASSYWRQGWSATMQEQDNRLEEDLAG